MAKKFQPGERVWITHDGREMEAVVIDNDDKTRSRQPYVWVRSHGGYGRALGYKARDVRRKPRTGNPDTKYILRISGMPALPAASKATIYNHLRQLRTQGLLKGHTFSIRKAKAEQNPASALPIGKKVPVYAKRLRNGRIELYR